jgi:hypothetical protein
MSSTPRAAGPEWSQSGDRHDGCCGQPDEKVRKFGENSDFERPGQPVELAPVYVLLASQEGSLIDGEVYGLTGGKGVA